MINNFVQIKSQAVVLCKLIITSNNRVFAYKNYQTIVAVDAEIFAIATANQPYIVLSSLHKYDSRKKWRAVINT